MSKHPTAAELESLVRGDLDRQEARSVVRHLLRGCDECMAKIGPYAGTLLDGINPARTARLPASRPEWEQPAARLGALFRPSRTRQVPAPPAAGAEAPALANAYDRAIDRAFAAVVRHGEDAARLAARVRELVAQLGAADGTPAPAEIPAELRSLAGYEVLLERSWALRNDEPRQMVRLAELAVEVAAGLAGAGFSAGQVEDFVTRATVELANAYRVVDRRQVAHATLDVARVHFRAGSQDRLLGARLVEVEAGIRGDEEDWAAALAGLDAAIRTYRRFGDAHLVGRCLIRKGLYTAQAGRPDEAIVLLSAGLEKIDAAQEPQMAIAAIHNTAFSLMSSGRYREARSLLWRHLGLYQQHAGRQILHKLRWLQGQIHAGMNELDQAAEALEDARRGLAEAGRGHHFASATLELAQVRLRQGDDAEARRLAIEAADQFLGLETLAEDAAAMRYLRAQLEAGAVAPDPALPPTAELVEQVFQVMRAEVAARRNLAANRTA